MLSEQQRNPLSIRHVARRIMRVNGQIHMCLETQLLVQFWWLLAGHVTKYIVASEVWMDSEVFFGGGPNCACYYLLEHYCPLYSGTICYPFVIRNCFVVLLQTHVRRPSWQGNFSDVWVAMRTCIGAYRHRFNECTQTKQFLIELRILWSALSRIGTDNRHWVGVYMHRCNETATKVCDLARVSCTRWTHVCLSKWLGCLFLFRLGGGWFIMNFPVTCTSFFVRFVGGFEQPLNGMYTAD